LKSAKIQKQRIFNPLIHGLISRNWPKELKIAIPSIPFVSIYSLALPGILSQFYHSAHSGFLVLSGSMKYIRLKQRFFAIR